jgi:predicted  nucleic acid-binding Zn-ribbon protein
MDYTRREKSSYIATERSVVYNAYRTMNTDDKIVKILENLQSGQKALQADVQKQGERLEGLQDDVTAVKADVAAVKAETGKIPAIEQRLDHHGKLLTGLTASMATVLEEQHAQRSDIRSLHTELHESREELKGEIREARDEAKRDTIDLKATVVKKIQSLDRRTTNIEEHEGIDNPDKN